MLAASSRTVRVLCLVPVLFLAWITIRTSAGFSVKHIPVGRLTEEHVERNRGVGGSKSDLTKTDVHLTDGRA